MEDKISKFDLASFKKSNDAMIAQTENAYSDMYLRRRQVQRTRDYTAEEIEKIVTSGDVENQIQLSRNYFYKNGFYKRIILYYATLLKYTGVLIPNPAPKQNLSNTKIQERYYKAVDFIERTRLESLLTECSIRALRDGCYYGVIQTNDKSSFALLDLPVGYCTSRFKDIHGNDVIEFDTRYFNSIHDEDKRNDALATYPKFISRHYNRWIKNRVKTSWVIIPSDIGVCFPFLDGRPLFLNVIPATIQYDDAVETERERALEEIRKIIVQKIPHLTDGGLLFEPEEAEEIHRGTVGMMKPNKNVSVLTTYADVDAIVSHTAADSVSNNLEKMVQNIYNEGGVSKEIFSPTGSSSLETSVQNDTALMMILGNKYSRFISNLVNELFANSTVSFKYTILPITYYNESTYITDSFKLAQSGYSFILPALALGFSQRDIGNIKDLENDVLKLGERMIPLASAYTQSAAAQESKTEETETQEEGKATTEQVGEEGGRPKLKESEKSAKTIKNEKSLEKQGGSK